jgi:hypothetical protein
MTREAYLVNHEPLVSLVCLVYLICLVEQDQLAGREKTILAQQNFDSLHVQEENTPARCSKRLSSKAAASEGPMRILWGARCDE